MIPKSSAVFRHLYFPIRENNTRRVEEEKKKARANLVAPYDSIGSSSSGSFEAIPRYRGTTTQFPGNAFPYREISLPAILPSPYRAACPVPLPERLFLRPSYWTWLYTYTRASMVGSSGCEPTLLRPPSCSGRDTIFYEALLLGVHGLGRVL